MIRTKDTKTAKPSEHRQVRYEKVGDRYRIARDVAAAPAREAETAAAVPPKPEVEKISKVAILTAHGMGQQIQFETLESVARGLCEADGEARPKVTVSSVAFGELRVQRLEMTLRNAKGAGPVEAHLYEAYWAPMTEGRVNVRDVFRFLAAGAVRGVLEGFKPFFRWMFGNSVRFRSQIPSAIFLVVATLALLEIAALNVLAPAVLATRLKAGWLSVSDERTLGIATAWLDLFLASAAILVVAITISRWQKKVFPDQRWLGGAFRIAAIVSLVLVVTGFVLLPIAVWRGWLPPSGWMPVSIEKLTSGMGIGVTWALLVILTWRLRYFLIQYVGDVAAYVSPQKLDRFFELRNEIKLRVLELAKAIFGSESRPGVWEYEGVAVVGHSLGSVVAYDTINRLLSDDRKASPSFDVLGRMRLLLTFGSPLDKTAYIFGLHGRDTRVLREEIAAHVQPLIDNYAYRTFPWINVYSRYDIISGRLDFYDDNPEKPAFPDRRVKNFRDDDANTPLAAHTEYWKNRKVWAELLANF